MGFGRSIFRPAATLAAWHANGQLRAFMAAHKRTRQVQERFLAELLAAHAETDFGRDHGLAKVRNWEDYRRAVPVGSYETLRPYMQRVLEGQTTALLPPDQRVLMFSMTSGTTGKPKFIPVTQRFLADIRRGWNVFGLHLLNQYPRAWLRPLVQLSSSMREQTSPAGLPCGSISGLLAARQKRIVRWMYVVPGWAGEITEPEAKYYTVMRFSIEKDVAFITTANPSSTIKLIETAQRHAERLIRDLYEGSFNPPAGTMPPAAKGAKFRPNRALARRLEKGIAEDGELRPRHFWRPEFLTNWTGGTLRLYLRRLRAMFDNIPVHDIGLLASEGRFSVPLENDTPGGVAEITSNFLEFIPAEDRCKSDPPTLLADELEVGGEYFLVLSNWAGLLRYNLDDRVRVNGFLGHSPIFEFLCRGLHTASITGEKITEHQVVEAMRSARRQTGASVERFRLQGRFADTPYYELQMEPPDGVSPEALAACMDRSLGELNVEYASKRKGCRLGAICPVVLPNGTLGRAELQHVRQRRGRYEQYKHQYLLTEVLEESGKENEIC